MSAPPPGWAWATLGDVCDRAAKWDPRSELAVEFQYIDISSIDEQKIQRATRIIGAEAPSRARQLVCAGDTVLSTVRTYLVNTARVPDELDGATASTGFCVLRPTDAIDSRFLFYRVIESGFVEALSRRQTGSSYPAVRDRDVFDQPIALPPLAEQLRIAAAIEQHLSRIDAAERSLLNARSKAAALRATILAAATDGFECVELDALVTGLRYGTSVKCSYDAPGPPVLRIPNVQGGTIDLSDIKHATDAQLDLTSFSVESGDLLFVRTNGSRDLIGRVASVDGAAGMAFASYLIRARPDPARLDSRYAVIALSTPQMRSVIESKAATTAGQYNLNLAALRSLEIPLPPIHRQRSIVQEVEHRLAAADALEVEVSRGLRRSSTLRKSILARAFGGELVAQDPDDEPASVMLERIGERAAVAESRSKRRVVARA